MKKWFTCILATLVFVFLPLCTFNDSNSISVESHLSQTEASYSPHSTSSRLNKLVLGYYAVDYTGDMLSYNSLEVNYAWIDNIAIFNYLIDERGNLVGQPYSEAADLARSRDTKSLMMVHNFDGKFKPELVHQALAVEESRLNLEKNILSMIKEHRFDGVNIDLEGIPLKDQVYYSSFP